MEYHTLIIWAILASAFGWSPGQYEIKHKNTHRVLLLDGPTCSGVEQKVVPRMTITADANYLNRATWEIKESNGHAFIVNVATGCFLFSQGERASPGSEGGWMLGSQTLANTVIGADQNFFNRASWMIESRHDSSVLIRSFETKRYLLADGLALVEEPGSEAGWCTDKAKARMAYGSDANYYDLAVWMLVPTGQQGVLRVLTNMLDVGDSTSEVVECEDDLSDARRLLNAKERELTDLRNDMHKEGAKSKAELTETLEKLYSKERELDLLQKEVATSKQKLTEGYQEKMDSKEREIANLRLLNAKERELTDLRNDLHKESAKLKSDLTETLEKLYSRKRELDLLQKEVAKPKLELTETLEKLYSKERELDLLQKEVATSKQKLTEGHREKMDSKEREIANLRLLNAKERELTDLRNDLHKEVAKSKSALEKLYSEEREPDLLQKEVAKSKQNLTEGYRAKMDSQEREIANLRKDLPIANNFPMVISIAVVFILVAFNLLLVHKIMALQNCISVSLGRPQKISQSTSPIPQNIVALARESNCDDTVGTSDDTQASQSSDSDGSWCAIDAESSVPPTKCFLPLTAFKMQGNHMTFAQDLVVGSQVMQGSNEDCVRVVAKQLHAKQKHTIVDLITRQGTYKVASTTRIETLSESGFHVRLANELTTGDVVIVGGQSQALTRVSRSDQFTELVSISFFPDVTVEMFHVPMRGLAGRGDPFDPVTLQGIAEADLLRASPASYEE